MALHDLLSSSAKVCFKMAGMTSVGRLLERHKSEFNDIDTLKLIQKLESAGAITPEEKHQLEDANTPSKRTDEIVNLISRKGYSAFQELCLSLESVCPHLLTKFALDIAGKLHICCFFCSFYTGIINACLLLAAEKITRAQDVYLIFIPEPTKRWNSAI